MVSGAIYEIDSTTRYRKMPAYGEATKYRSSEGQALAERRCQRRTGHVLTVEGEEIRCRECGATWRDHGF